MRAANVTRVSKWGESRRYYFNNGYGASVIRGPYTPRGIWDLSVLRMAADGRRLLCITTPIADDVIGYRLVLIAQRDLARKARRAAEIKALFSLENRVTLKLPKGS